MKSKRQQKILELINSHDIETQEELTGLLIKEGFDVTQATTSRDMKELQIIKNGNKYIVNTFGLTVPAHSETGIKYIKILEETVTGCDIAKNLIVVKTHSGMAQAAAAAIDAFRFEGVVGTIAGDDTILIVICDDDTAADMIKGLRKIIKQTP